MTNPESRTLSARSNPLRFGGTVGLAAQEAMKFPLACKEGFWRTVFQKPQGTLTLLWGFFLAFVVAGAWSRLPWRTIGFEGIVGIEVVWLNRRMRVSPMYVAGIREYEDG